MNRQHFATRQSISVFFPCYNDSKSIKKLVTDSFLILKALTPWYEVIVVDDHSSDNSREILKRLTQKYPKLKLIFHPKNLGYGEVLKSGIRASRYSLVFYTDGDGQYDVKELPILVSLMSEDINFVNGIKLARKDPTYRILMGNLYSFLARWFFWLPVLDVDCDFRLIRKNLLDRLDLKSSSGSICIELVKKAQQKGGKFCQVSVHHYERAHGHSQFFQLKHLFKTLLELFYLWFELMIFGKHKLVRKF